MKTIAVPAGTKALNDLLKKAWKKSLILQSHDGRRFVLAPVEGWDAFEVGDDITQNKKLMKHLSERRSKGKTIPIEEVKAKLGIR
jgi:hypothetical protein